MSLIHNLKGSAIKASLVAAVGGVTALVFLDGNASTNVMGHYIPRAAAMAGSLFVGTLATDMALPYVLPWEVGKIGGLGSESVEQLVLQPLMGGVFALAIESILAPTLLTAEGGMFKALLVGGSATVGGSYIANGMGWTPNVVNF